MDTIFTKAIYQELFMISDIKILEQMWLNPNSKLISSYNEFICTLYDDNLFDDFALFGAKVMGFTHELISLLQKFDMLINNFDKKSIIYKSDKDLVNDDDWLIIVELAKEIVLVWPEKYKSDFLKYLES